MKTLLNLLLIALFLGFANAQAQETPAELVSRRFYQLTGLEPKDDAQVKELAKASRKDDGDIDEAKLFRTIVASEEFINTRLSDFVSRISNEEAEPYEDVDDLQASILLAILGDHDLRSIFTRPFYIEKISQPGMPAFGNRNAIGFTATPAAMSEIPKSLRLKFDIQSGSPAQGVYTDGLFVSRGFAMRNFSSGTNRRPIRAIYDQFLCTKIDQWKDASLDDFYVGKDIDRVPSDNPDIYQTTCRGCHAPMDSQRGAFAHYDYEKLMEQVNTSVEVLAKYNRNDQVFSRGGYVTRDARWEILLTDPSAQAHFGWRGGPKAMAGKGVLSYASAIVNSRQFQTCITQRLINTFCDKSDAREYSSKPEFKTLVNSFRELDNYRVLNLIERIVSSDLCKN